MKLQDYTEQINKISDVAAKEYSIEQALDKMEEQWAPIEFEVMEYKDTGTYIIKARVALILLSMILRIQSFFDARLNDREQPL